MHKRNQDTTQASTPQSVNSHRRSAIKKIGAAAGALSMPLAFGSGFANASPGSNLETQAESSDQTQIPEPELDQYGIRGFQAPELEISYWIDANGEPTDFSVHAQKNKWLFMKFFQAWCPGCHKFGFPTLKKFADEFKDHPDVEAVAVQTVFEGASFNTVEKVREIQLQYDLPIKMGHDIGTAATQHHPLSMINYRTGGTPWLILIGPDGMVVHNDFHVDSDSLIDFLKQHVS